MAVRRRSRICLSTLYRALFLPEQDLSADESGSTFFRFFRSKHVADLRLIVALALAMLALHAFVVGIFAADDVYDGAPKTAPATVLIMTQNTTTPSWTAAPALPPKAMTTAGKALDFFQFFSTYFGAALPIYGAIVAWAYLTASARLGIVDLFASEISTVCRVGTIFEIGKTSIKLLDVKNRIGSASFTGKEEYFPVFDQNAHDLQVLEASVVENITEFYTYMKAMRDSRRKLSEIEPQNSGGGTESDPWQTTACNVIFVLFLAYESGRLAVDDLVEFQPAKAERTIVAFLTELTCYKFLVKFFADHFGENDLRSVRLRLRESNYKEAVAPELYCRVIDGYAKNKTDWERAKNTLPSLELLYVETFKKDLAVAASKYREEHLQMS
jgi:hypothetical protein